jgi:hypothetical protein
MGADPIVYCLEQVTDYDQFERLAHDLMALDGYRNIEPLGSTKDKGRDALHSGDNGKPQATIFAYSVREDWRKKLSEDSDKISKHSHPCGRFVFLCTARFTASERDEAHDYITKNYGWEFHLFGIERLRTLLATTCKEVVANHPQIFCLPFFPTVGGLSISPRYDYLILDHLDADETLAQWLARRLILAGYRVWCRNMAPLAGTSANESIKTLIKTRAFRYLPLLTPESAATPDLAARRALAHTLGDQRAMALVIPLYAAVVAPQRLEAETSRLEGIHFENGWAPGLRQLLATLEAAQCPRHALGPTNFVIESFMPPNVLVNQPETLAANIFPVSKIPIYLKRWEAKHPLHQDDIEQARLVWAFRKVDTNRFISFCEPPSELTTRFDIAFAGRANWNDVVVMDNIRTRDIAKELLRRSLEVVCASKGMTVWSQREYFYFPQKLLPRDLLAVRPIEGKARRVGVVGERTFGVGKNKSRYRYHLALTFAGVWNTDCYGIIVRPRIHITNLQGETLTPRSALARRKDIGGTWWNNDWFLRILGAMQFLADGETIAIGTIPSEQLVINKTPRTWPVDVSISDAAVRDAKADRDEIVRHDDFEEEAVDESSND